MRRGGARPDVSAAQDAIVVQGLSKTYQVPEREGGFAAALRSIVRRQYRDVQAVHAVGFTIKSGEEVDIQQELA